MREMGSLPERQERPRNQRDGLLAWKKGEEKKEICWLSDMIGACACVGEAPSGVASEGIHGESMDVCDTPLPNRKEK